jgi:hypothetical protein
VALRQTRQIVHVYKKRSPVMLSELVLELLNDRAQHDNATNQSQVFWVIEWTGNLSDEVVDREAFCHRQWSQDEHQPGRRVLV